VASCLAKCVEVGGRPYLYGWHRLGRRTLEDLYGGAWGRLLELRRELDPAGVFQPGKLLLDAEDQPRSEPIGRRAE
jgi:FAD/FMN-containing dehydrogenase